MDYVTRMGWWNRKETLPDQNQNQNRRLLSVVLRDAPAVRSDETSENSIDTAANNRLKV